MVYLRGSNKSSSANKYGKYFNKLFFVALNNWRMKTMVEISATTTRPIVL